jgi:hypothetical protein
LLAFVAEQNARLSVIAAKATGTLSMPTNPTDGQTVTVDGKVYTFQDTLTNVDGNVKKAGSANLSIINLYEALDAPENGGAPGSDYALSMTDHSTVQKATGSTFPAGTTLPVEAKTAGAAGNALATTTNVTGASWGGATLSGGATALSFSTFVSLLKNGADKIRSAASAAALAA